MLILPYTDSAGATLLADRLRHIVSQVPFGPAESGMFSITMSGGVVSYARDIVTSSEMVARANQALVRRQAPWAKPHPAYDRT
jgi:PleD family two-component response regulator